jgi:hypothetical protein
MAQLGQRRRMERSGHDAAVTQDRHSLDHLARGLVREGDEQDLIGPNGAGLDGVRRPPADNPRLAGARAGDDRQRSGRDA